MFGRKLTEDEKYRKWFDKCNRQVKSKYFFILWASFENQTDLTYIDRLIDEGYSLVHVYAVTMEGQRLVFQKPQTSLESGSGKQ